MGTCIRLLPFVLPGILWDCRVSMFLGRVSVKGGCKRAKPHATRHLRMGWGYSGALRKGAYTDDTNVSASAL